MTAKSTGTNNRREAEKRARKLVEEQKTTIDERKTMLFSNFAQETWDFATSAFIARANKLSNRMSQAYVQGKHDSLKKHCPGFFKSKRLEDITSRDLDDFAIYLKDRGLANVTVRNILNGCEQALSWAHYEKLIPASIKSLITISRQGKERDSFSDEEIMRLVDIEWENPMGRLIFEIAFISGLRLGEILALRREDLLPGMLVVKHSWSQVTGLKSPKNGKTRKVPIPDAVYIRILSHIEDSGCSQGYLFPCKTGEKPISDSVPRKAFYKAMLAIGISTSERRDRKLGFHSCRHWFNAVFRRNENEQTLRQVIGHQSVKMTDAYDHQRPEDLDRFREAQDGILAGISA